MANEDRTFKMLGNYQTFVQSQLEEIRSAGFWKPERVLASAQRPAKLRDGAGVLVLCANNYLGLADDPLRGSRRGAMSLEKCAATAWRRCASFAAPRINHKQAGGSEISGFLGYRRHHLVFFLLRRQWRACLKLSLQPRTTRSFPMSLNHASIIDGIRLMRKPSGFRYANELRHRAISRNAQCESRTGRAFPAWSPLTAFFPWMATSRRSREICNLADR